jgi:hypothetical protein
MNYDHHCSLLFFMIFDSQRVIWDFQRKILAIKEIYLQNECRLCKHSFSEHMEQGYTAVAISLP